MHNRFREPVSLRDVAREVAVHPVYLARVFRQRLGCSVSEYLRSLRLAEAGRLVLEGSPLIEAAYAAGFADQAHFSRCFKAEFGFPPGGYGWHVRPSKTDQVPSIQDDDRRGLLNLMH